MNYYFWLYLWSLFHTPHYQPPPQPQWQPAYQLEYQRQLLEYNPVVIVPGPGSLQPSAPPQIAPGRCVMTTPTSGYCAN